VGTLLTLLVAVTGSLIATRLATRARRIARIDRARGLRRAGRGPRALPIPASVARWLEQALERADVRVSADDAVRLALAGTLAAALVAAMVAPTLVLPAVVGVLALGPVGLTLARRRRDRAVVAAVPDVVDHLAAELRSGGTVALAIATLAAGETPLAADFTRVEERCRLGASTKAALHAWAAERDAPGVREVAAACAVALEAGGAVADALEGLGSALRDRAAVAAEAHALAAQARLSAVVIGAAPIAYLAWSSLVDPRSLSALIGTPLGRVCLVAGSACEVAGALWMRRILRSGT
jgi:tight adherence protein B